MKNYSEMPNGGPYGSSHNIYPAGSQQQLRASPQPPRSLSPTDYTPPNMGGSGDRGHYERESPYHNLPSYEESAGGGDYDREYYDEGEERVLGDPHSSDFLPSHSVHPYSDGDMHADFGQR